MSNRAFLVVGPESSGTRFATSIFIAAGCYGDSTHEQRLDNAIPTKSDVPLVWRHSYPHNKVWYPIYSLKIPLMNMGYTDIHVIPTMRDWYSTIQSQLTNKYINSVMEGYSNIERAYKEIFKEYSGDPIFNYEAAILLKEKYIEKFLAPYGLFLQSPIEFINGDSKYYG